MNHTNDDLGTFIATRRRELHMSQHYVAACCGKSRAWLSMVERGKITYLPSPEIVDTLAVLLAVSPEEILMAAGYSLSMTVSIPWKESQENEELKVLLDAALAGDLPFVGAEA